MKGILASATILLTLPLAAFSATDNKYNHTVSFDNTIKWQVYFNSVTITNATYTTTAAGPIYKDLSFDIYSNPGSKIASLSNGSKYLPMLAGNHYAYALPANSTPTSFNIVSLITGNSATGTYAINGSGNVSTWALNAPGKTVAIQNYGTSYMFVVYAADPYFNSDSSKVNDKVMIQCASGAQILSFGKAVACAIPPYTGVLTASQASIELRSQDYHNGSTGSFAVIS